VVQTVKFSDLRRDHSRSVIRNWAEIKPKRVKCEAKRVR